MSDKKQCFKNKSIVFLHFIVYNVCVILGGEWIMKKGLIVTAIIVVLFALAIFLSYKIVNKGKTNKDEKVDIYSEVSIPKGYVKNEEKDATKVEETEYSEINKDSQVANDLFNFIPKSFQTYPGKMNEDYMLYEAISRISNDESVTKLNVNGMTAYKFEDVDKMIKNIYGENTTISKKETYSSPVDYLEKEDAFTLYPVGIDNTDNMMVIKSVQENDKMFKITVYSVCVYMDMESANSNNLYLVTKDTIKEYYRLVSRNSDSIKKTYKEFKLEGKDLNPNEIVEKYEEVLPQIEYYLAKTNDKENKYYVLDIKDIY